MAKDVLLPFVLGIAGLAITWVLYKMFESKKDRHLPDMAHVPIHVPSGLLHTSSRIVDTTGTGPSAARRVMAIINDLYVVYRACTR